MSGFILKKRYAYMPQPQCNITLKEACEKDDISLAKKAIKEGAYNIQSCLIIAIEKGYVKLAKYLSECYRNCVLQYDGISGIKTIMYHACLHDHDSIVSDILEFMSIIGVMNIEVYNKGLYGACEGNNVELIERMITLGADDIVQGFFKTCLGDSLDAAKYLINRCLIDVNSLDNYVILQGILFSCVHNRINVGRYLLDIIHNDDGILEMLSSLIYDITVDNITKKLVISRSGFYPTNIESFTDLNRYMMYLSNDLKFQHSSWFLSRVLSDDMYSLLI